MAAAPAVTPMPANGNGNGLLKLRTNVPEEIALRFPTGKRMTNEYGDYLLYSLTDGRKICLPLHLEDKIAALGLAPQEPFNIKKAEVRRGQSRSIEYQVSRIYPPGETPAAPPAAATASGTAERPIETNNGQVSARSRMTYEQAYDIYREIAVRQAKAFETAGIRVGADKVAEIATTLFIQAGKDGVLTPW